MTQYMVQRVDISSAYVEADSPEEALAIANDDPELWSYEAGVPEVMED